MSVVSKESILIRRLRGERTEQVPCWFMRQAGRYLPEYRELRKKHSMLDAIRTPEIAAEITLQPLRRFPLDGGIIFADILNPLIGMGIELDFIAGEGPKIFNPIASIPDIDRLVVPAPEENIGYTLRAIEIVCKELAHKQIPLLGFSGAPFTLASYIFKDSESPNHVALKSFIQQEPKAWELLHQKLCTLVADYLVAQVRSGVSAVQLFDSWVGALGPAQFKSWVVPGLKEIVARVRREVSAPIIYFATGVAGLLPEIGQLGFDAVGVDWRVDLRDAATLLGGKVAMQGNLDPAFLTLPFAHAEEEVRRVLNEGAKVPSHIFNVGHGLTPQTNPETIAKVVEMVHGFREK